MDIGLGKVKIIQLCEIFSLSQKFQVIRGWSMPHTWCFLSASFSTDTAGHIAPKSMRATSSAGSQSEALFTRTF
jgi:hypothetical protein